MQGTKRYKLIRLKAKLWQFLTVLDSLRQLEAGEIMNTKIRIQRICKHCGEEFTARTTVTQFCGDNCAKRAYKVRLRQAKIEKSNAETQAIRDKPLEDLRAKDFLSIAETCALLGLSERTVFRLLQNGRIPASKFGRRTIIKRADLEQLFV